MSALCSFDGCTRSARAVGLCKAHYNQKRRRGADGLRPLSSDRGPDGCTFDGCDRPLFALALCQGHYGQRRRGTELRPLGEPRKVYDPDCSFAGCDRPHYCKGLCSGHYQQRKRGYVLAPLGESGRGANSTAHRADGQPVGRAPQGAKAGTAKGKAKGKKRKGSKLPPGWERTTPPPVLRTDHGVRTLPYQPPLPVEHIAAARRLLDRFGALDLVDVLGLDDLEAAA